MRCNDKAPNIGTQMRTFITQRYKLWTFSEVGDHKRQLQTKQRGDEKIKDWWIEITTSTAYMQAARRYIADRDLCDIVRDNALSILAS